MNAPPFPPSFDRLVEYKTLLNAWKVVSGKGANGGVDGVSVSDFEKDLGSHIGELRKRLKDKQWKPQPYLTISIPKKSGERRKLGLLTIKDKIVQQAIKQMVEQRFERTFSKSVCAYRTGLGHTKAVRKTKAICMEKAVTHIVKFDIDNYFDNIDHALLFKRIVPVVVDQEILRLIELSVKMGMVNKKMKWEEITKGVPQGAVLSPLLANYYLVPFDQFVLSRTTRYVRYADDFVIGCTSEQEASEMVKQVTTFLSTRLKLSLNEPCIKTVSEGVDFLGLHIDNTGFDISEEKEKDLYERIACIKWVNNAFDAKGLERLDGIHRYYVPLLPEPILRKLDEKLIEQINGIIDKQFSQIAGRSVLSEALLKIRFTSEANIVHAKQLRDAWLERYTANKREAGAVDARQKNKKVIAQRKHEYRMLEAQTSELIVGTPGSFIGVSNTGITVKLYGKAQNIPPTPNLQHIAVTADGVSISSNALKYCLEHGIGIDFFDAKGQHVGGFINAAYFQTTKWAAQAQLPGSRRFELAQTIIAGKLRNQYNLIKYFHKYHKATNGKIAAVYDEVSKQLERLLEQLKQSQYLPECDYRPVVMAIEAQGAAAYWKYIKILLEDDKVGFEGRERKGATDLVNCMLNYGYAILYSQIWRALLRYKLNPYDSVLHALQSGKPTFVFDLIELFRSQAVDRVVVSLIQKKEKLEVKNGLLDEDTRKMVAARVMERLNRYEKFRKQELRLRDIINQQVRDVAKFIVGEGKFKPYVAKW